MNQQAKDQIGNAAQQHADNCIFSPYDNHRGIARASYIAGAETWAERGEVLKEALEKLNKELDYFWNSSRTISSRKIIPETIKRAICAAQKECAKALSNYNNPVK